MIILKLIAMYIILVIMGFASLFMVALIHRAICWALKKSENFKFKNEIITQPIQIKVDNYNPLLFRTQFIYNEELPNFSKQIMIDSEKNKLLSNLSNYIEVIEVEPNKFELKIMILEKKVYNYFKCPSK